MIVGIVGLGLIGGSMAKAYHEKGHTVWGHDADPVTEEFAVLGNITDGSLTMENLSRCELLLLAAYPAGAEEYLTMAAPRLSPSTVVIDCLGTKQRICKLGFRLKYARGDLFKGAPMVIVPPRYDDMEFLEQIKAMLAPAEFGTITVTTAEKHDQMIAFTSQLAHVVSNAYIKSPTAGQHKGFSAGSYKDLTRVAWLNPAMWTELFLENGTHLMNELDYLIAALTQYRDAIAQQDAERLCRLLDDGRKRKKEIDG